MITVLDAAVSRCRGTLAAVAVLSQLAACALTQPHPLQCGIDDYLEPPGPVPFFAAPLRAVSGGAGTRSEDDKQNVLALSAGGEYGAYGTGFLREWNRLQQPQPISPRDFDVVTGVSTGAIIATHVYLDKFDEIDDLYRSISGKDIYERRSLLGMLFSDSMTDDSGKHALIRKNLEPLIDQVADEYRRNPKHRLLVGTVDAYTGEFLQVDLTRIATSAKLTAAQRHDCYIAMVDAASAIPLAFKPIFVDNRMLVDGGLRHYAFIQNPDEFKAHRIAAAGLDAAREARRKGTHRLFVIYHANLRTESAQVGDNLFDIAGRTSTIALDELTKDTAYRLDFVAHHPDFAYETYYLDARKAAYDCRKELCTPECKNSPGGEDMFCHPYMVCLSDRGKQDAARVAASGTWVRSLMTEDLGSAAGPNINACK